MIDSCLYKHTNKSESKRKKELQYKYIKMMIFFIPVNLGRVEMEPKESVMIGRDSAIELQTLETHTGVFLQKIVLDLHNDLSPNK